MVASVLVVGEKGLAKANPHHTQQSLFHKKEKKKKESFSFFVVVVSSLKESAYKKGKGKQEAGQEREGTERGTAKKSEEEQPKAAKTNGKNLSQAKNNPRGGWKFSTFGALFPSNRK